jgi:hypothetical protein
MGGWDEERVVDTGRSRFFDHVIQIAVALTFAGTKSAPSE